MRIGLSRISAVLALMLTLHLAASAEDKNAHGHWVSAWSTAMHTPLPFPGLPPSPVFENQTIRMVVRPTIGGDRIRVGLSNVYGTAPLEVGSAHVALLDHGSTISTDSDHPLSFGGQLAVTIPPGAPILSDPLDMRVAPFAELAVSVYLPRKTSTSTVHFWAQHETYISGPGDFTAKAGIADATVKTSWYWLADA